MADKLQGFTLAAAQPVAGRENAGQTIHVRDETGTPLFYGPSDAPKPVTMLIAGTYSDIYRQKELDQQRRPRKMSVKPDPELVLANVIELEAACILEWDGFTENGAPVPLTIENAVAVLKAAKWLREQVEAAMNDHAGFSKGSSKS